MRRPKALPSRLRYLEPVRKQLRALRPDEINESTGLSVLRKVIRKRLKDLPDDQARTLLAKDAAELENWLATCQESDHRLFFILPILPDAKETLFTDSPQVPPERGEASMELPNGARLTIENGCWSVTWKRMLLSLYPSHREDMQRHAGQCRKYAEAEPMIDDDGAWVEDVRFGETIGIKCVRKSKSRSQKQVEYALEVPGGYIVAIVRSTPFDFNESGFEQHFHTLRVLNYAPPPEVQNAD